MVTITLELELPDWVEAGELAEPLRLICEDTEQRGGRVVVFEHGVGPVCGECGAPMVYEAVLQTHVCHHGD